MWEFAVGFERVYSVFCVVLKFSCREVQAFDGSCTDLFVISEMQLRVYFEEREIVSIHQIVCAR